MSHSVQVQFLSLWLRSRKLLSRISFRLLCETTHLFKCLCGIGTLLLHMTVFTDVVVAVIMPQTM